VKMNRGSFAGIQSAHAMLKFMMGVKSSYPPPAV
jgi:hypothetical protein